MAGKKPGKDVPKRGTKKNSPVQKKGSVPSASHPIGPTRSARSPAGSPSKKPGAPSTARTVSGVLTAKLVAATAAPGLGPISIGPTTPGLNRPLSKIEPVVNFFHASRPGHAVVRPWDLLVLRLELHNLIVQPGNPPRLKNTGSGPAHLVVHFPPQAITEQTFFEKNPKGFDPETNGQPSDQLTGPPVNARIAGESRLVFKVPTGFDVPYTLEGVLAAVENLALSVPANAIAPEPEQHAAVSDIFMTDIGPLQPFRRAALSSFVLRTLRIAAIQGDTATAELRLAAAAAELGHPAALRRPAVMNVGRAIGRIVARAIPMPAPPASMQTAIEMPWRLILSPHSAERWRHAKGPVISPATRHTELWHSRLVAPPSKRTTIKPPQPDGQRTVVRAVWALTGEGSESDMEGNLPNKLPTRNQPPFAMPLEDSDRFQFVHLSSNFSIPNYRPNAIGVNLLMLSALGGWLDSRGAWNPPPPLSVEEWLHRASMARDHYVRVVYKGFLFPFGHRVSLVKMSERKFHNGARDQNSEKTIEQMSGNTAYLRQRFFIVIRERERRFVDPALRNWDKAAPTVYWHRQMPFSSVRILTTVTPNLDPPNQDQSQVQRLGQKMFWPYVNGIPFRFQCAATDLDGRNVQFELPMIFMDNAMVAPAPLNTGPNYEAAEKNAEIARTEWGSKKRQGLRVADFKQQRVSLAQSEKPGDTAVFAEEVSFDAEVEPGNELLQEYSADLTRPLFYPKVSEAKVSIPALAQLTGSGDSNKVTWNSVYLEHGFSEKNQGQVFVDVKDEPNMALLDFSTQGDRSGCFIHPNLKPSALSRLSGLVTGPVKDFIEGNFSAEMAFPSSSFPTLPPPLLLGCIPLGEVIEDVTNLAAKAGQIPRFVSEASTQVEDFFNGLGRLFDLVSKLSDQPARYAEAAIKASRSNLIDLIDQAQAYSKPLVAGVETNIDGLAAALETLRGKVQPLIDELLTEDTPALPKWEREITGVRTAVTNLRDTANAPVDGVSLPAGFRQSLLQVAIQIEAFVCDLEALRTLLTQGKALFAALDPIVGKPNQLINLLSNRVQLTALLDAVRTAVGPLCETLSTFRLLEGAPRHTLLSAIDAMKDVLGDKSIPDDLIEKLTGDDLTIRFDWNPEVKNWPKGDNPIFRANNKRGFLVTVEAKVNRSGNSPPKFSVVSSLKHFDLVLIKPAEFLELNFEKIEFRAESGTKMDLDVLLSDIKFVGPLSFVETLRDLIPLDGFSDPPHLNITPQGIDAGYSLTVPNISVGVFNLSNLSLVAGFTIPFIAQPLAVRFNFCSREQPFNLTVSLFGGGGFFAVTLDPRGIQILEAAFEFGASVSINFGVASGGVHVMAGIYFRMEQTECKLAGYFRLGGHVRVLGLISASIELYLVLNYQPESGKCVGMAQLTIEVEVFLFSKTVTITCERKFAGSNGDPTFRELMGPDPSLPLREELASIDNHTLYAWREYCEAFA